MQIKALKTHRVTPGDSLEGLLDCHVGNLKERDVLVLTSKIISLCQGQVVSKDTMSKKELIYQQAEAVLDVTDNPYNIYLTLKDNLLLPTAGIDESNSNNLYILYPQNVQETAYNLWNLLRKKHSLQHLGVLITDSRTTPLRRGVTGIALGWCGFEPQYSYVGKPDLYGNPLRVTSINLLDALATSAVLVMGEGDEQTPLAVIREAPKLSFVERSPTPEEIQSITIPMEEDLYAPFFQAARWIRPAEK